ARHARRVQRQVHEQHVRAPRRELRHQPDPHPPDLPQLLPRHRDVAVHRHPAGAGRVGPVARSWFLDSRFSMPPPSPASPDPENEAAEREAFRHDVLAGLSAEAKSIPCKYFYDERGSALFERITETEEYYPTRAELAIMEAHGGAMARRIGPRAALIEYGSGSSRKTRVLLDHLDDPAA